MDIFVGNMPYTTSEDDVKELFGAFGQVDRVKIITDHETGRSKGFAFVTMPDAIAAQEAMRNLDGQEWNGRPLRVNEAQRRDDRPPRSSGDGGDYQDRGDRDRRGGDRDRDRDFRRRR